MPTRISSLSVAVIALTCSLVGPRSASAQVERVADPAWTTPRTADGQPDLQGPVGQQDPHADRTTRCRRGKSLPDG